MGSLEVSDIDDVVPDFNQDAGKNRMRDFFCKRSQHYYDGE